MSILIKGLEMPKSCPCELLGIGYDLCCNFAGGIPARVKEYYECCQNDTRPSWCPLVPVPPHGRLGDLDALKETIEALIEKHLHGYTKSTWDFVCELRSIISDAPTVIPAEIISEKEIKIIDTKGKPNYDPKRRFVIPAEEEP